MEPHGRDAAPITGAAGGQRRFDGAIAAGAEVFQEPERKRADDDFRAGVRDPSGTTWWIASR